jgi:hypothetical protein
MISNEWMFIIVLVGLVLFYHFRSSVEGFNGVMTKYPTPPCWGKSMWGKEMRPFYEYGPQTAIPHPYQDACHDYANEKCQNSGNWNCYQIAYQQCSAQS